MKDDPFKGDAKDFILKQPEPPKPAADKTSLLHIHCRPEEKHAWIRAARPQKLEAWVRDVLNKASGYPPV